MAGTQSRPIADANNADRCKSSRPAFRLEAPLDRGEQGFGHGMTATGTTDQDRVAILHQSSRFVRRNFFHDLFFTRTCIALQRQAG
jgi:hypothetical protein